MSEVNHLEKSGIKETWVTIFFYLKRRNRRFYQTKKISDKILSLLLLSDNDKHFYPGAESTFITYSGLISKMLGESVYFMQCLCDIGQKR